MTRGIAGLAAAFALAIGLGGCATQPIYPLMTPIQVAQVYGYAERPADAGHWEVSYVTPPLAALGYRFDVSPTAERAGTMAFDLASLRAAQLAEQSGWQGFDIVDKHTSSDDEFVGPAWGDGPWGPGWGGRWRHRYGWWGDDYYPPEQRVQAEARLTVVFTNDVKPGQYRAADVVQQVAARYPGALGPPPPPAPAPQAKPST